MNTPITDELQSGLHEIDDKLEAALSAMRVLEGRYHQQVASTEAAKDQSYRNHTSSLVRKTMYLEQYKIAVGQRKGLNRQARKIKRLKARIAELES